MVAMNVFICLKMFKAFHNGQKVIQMAAMLHPEVVGIGMFEQNKELINAFFTNAPKCQSVFETNYNKWSH